MKFIKLEDKIEVKKRQPASYVRRSFIVNKGLCGATLEITALGVYIGYLNGERLGRAELLPGYTDYRYRVQAQKYDIVNMLHEGENVIGAIVGDGWYRGAIGISSKTNQYGTHTMLGCRITLCYDDGNKAMIDADEQFKVSNEGPLRINDLKVVEEYDARREKYFEGWNCPGFDASKWRSAIPASYPGNVVPTGGEPVLVKNSFEPKLIHTPDGSEILDFGQNHVGRVRFTVTGKSGQKVRLIMGETLDENGNFTLKNLIADGMDGYQGSLGMEVQYTLKDGTQTYEPLFKYDGYRYVKLVDWPEKIDSENFTSHVIYSDIRETGSFSCSNEKINQLISNTTWARRSNFIDIPTDCPTRERAGWTGDINVYIETALYMTDPRRFLKKWFEDYMLEQHADGSLPYVVPEQGYPTNPRSCTAWSDAIANISMEMYHFYGDKQLLENVYETIKRYVDYQLKRSRRINILNLFRYGFSGRQYILETGFHFGEWLEPGSVMSKDIVKAAFIPDAEVNTAWIYQTTSQLSKMAAILEKK